MRRPIQTELALRQRPRWGGARPGAGRKAGPNPRIRHLSRPSFGRTHPAHVTLKVQSGIPSLRTVPIVREVERSFTRGCRRPGFRLVHYSLQGSHAHLIVEAHDRDALGRGMKAITCRLARAVNRVAGRSGRVFADRYHLHLLRTRREVRAALRYVLLNARRHARRIGRARLDPASSGRWFDGWRRAPGGMDGLVGRRGSPVPPEDRGRDGPRGRAAGIVPVARARTWLLLVGWRRHGLLDATDVPGR